MVFGCTVFRGFSGSRIYFIYTENSCRAKIFVTHQDRVGGHQCIAEAVNFIDGPQGSDGSLPQQRASAAGYPGTVAETVAINPALAMSGIELINQWYYNPAYMAIMVNCEYTNIGVWSENSLDRTLSLRSMASPPPDLLGHTSGSNRL